MAKIKFMPVENPIDKLYSSATGMPFPVSAAAGQSSEPDPGPKPEPTPVCATPEVSSVNGYEYCETLDANIATGVATVTITCSTEGADIYYKKTGDADYTLYKDPFTLESSTQVEAYASKKDYDDSVKTTSLVTVYEAETCPEPEPEPEPLDAVAEVSYDDGENRYWCDVDIPLPEGIESELDISDITVHLGFNAESTLDGPCEEGTLEFAYSNGEGGMVQIQDGNLHISITIDTGESDCMTSLLCNEYNSEDAPYPYGLIEMWANEDIETGESDAFNYRLSWTFTGETPCNVGE